MLFILNLLLLELVIHLIILKLKYHYLIKKPVIISNNIKCYTDPDVTLIFIILLIHH